MSFLSGRYGSLFTVVVSVMLATCLGGVYYYFQIQQNENYQNQLHFRELQDIRRSVDNGLQTLSTIADEKRKQKPVYDQLVALQAEKAAIDNRIANNQQHYQQIQGQLALIEAQSNTINGKLRASSQHSSIEQNLAEQRQSLQTVSQGIDELQRQMAVWQPQFIEQMAETVNIALPFGKDMVNSWRPLCRLDNQHKRYCDWFDKVFDSVFNIDYYNDGQSPLLQPLFEQQRLILVDEQQLLTWDLELRLTEMAAVKQHLTAYQQLTVKGSVTGKVFSDQLQCSQRSRIWLDRYINCDFLYAGFERRHRAQQMNDSAANKPKDSAENRPNDSASVGQPPDHPFSPVAQANQSLAVVANNQQTDYHIKRQFNNALFSTALGVIEENIETLQLMKRKLAQVTQLLVDKKLSASVLAYIASYFDTQQLLLKSQQQQQAIKDEIVRLEQQRDKTLDNALTQQIVQLQQQRSDRQSQAAEIRQQILASLDTDNIKTLLSANHSQLLIRQLSDDFKDYVHCLQRLYGVDHLDVQGNCDDFSTAFGQDAKQQSTVMSSLSKRASALKNVKIHYYPANKPTAANSPENGDEMQLLPIAAPLTGQGLQVVAGLEALGAVLYAPFSDFLGTKSLRYPLVLLIDEAGKRQVRKENVENDSAQNGLIFEQLDALLEQLFIQQHGEQQHSDSRHGDQQHSHNDGVMHANSTLPQTNEPGAAVKKNLKAPGFSGYIDVAISGVDYRVFITPYSTNLLAGSQHFYLLGFKPKADLVSKKLAISNSIIVIVVLILIVLFALLPLLKLRFISSHDAFAIADRHWLMIGVGVFIGTITIGSVDWLLYNQLKTTVNQQAKYSFEQLKSSFNLELNSLYQYAQQESATLQQSEAIDSLLTKPVEPVSSGYLLENILTIPEGGKVTGEAKWSSRRLFRRSEIDVSGRQYFQQSIQCNAWNKNDCNVLFLERINNLRDGRRNTQFAKPLFADNQAEGKRVLTFGTTLQTFFYAMLGQDFGFLVFDNATGDVLYHDNDNRSLIENLYVEADNNAQLHGLKWLSQYAPYNQSSVAMNTVYRGEDHHFEVGALNADIPWTLVIYYQKNPLRLFNMLLVFSSLLVFILMIIGVYLVVRVLPVNWAMLRQLFWYDHTIGPAYKYLAGKLLLLLIGVNTVLYYWLVASDRYFWWQVSLGWLVCWALIVIGLYCQLRKISAKNSQCPPIKSKAENVGTVYSHGFSFYLLALLIGCAAHPALMVSLTSSTFYLQKRADIEALHLQQHYQLAKKERQAYFDLILDDQHGSDGHVQAGNVPCYIRYAPVPQDRAAPYLCRFDQVDQADQPSLWQGPLVLKNGLNQPDGQPSSVQSSRVNQGIIANLLTLVSTKGAVFNQVSALNIHHLTGGGAQGRRDQQPIDEIAINGGDGRLWRQALMDQWGLLLMLVALGLMVTYFILHELISKRLMGLGIPDNFRLNDSRGKNKIEKFLARLQMPAQSAQMKTQFIQLIRPTNEFIEQLMADPDNLCRFIAKTPVPIDRLIEQEGDVISRCENYLHLSRYHEHCTLVIKGIELVAFNCEQRQRALAVLEYLVSLRQVNIILLVEVAPLYRLTNQGAYLSSKFREHFALPSEVLRWAKLMNLFDKFYDWTPSDKKVLGQVNEAYQVLLDETNGWPEMVELKKQFISYHYLLKVGLARSEFLRLTESLSPEQSEGSLRESINSHWSAIQVSEFFGANAGAFYRYRWELCTRDERLLLIQMAAYETPNPQDTEALEHLIRRGYIYRDNGWHLINQSFQRFILSAEHPTIVRQWLEDVKESTWQYIRIPIYSILFAVLSIMAYSATDAVESVLAIVTALVSILPILTSGFSRSGDGGDDSGDGSSGDK